MVEMTEGTAGRSHLQQEWRSMLRRLVTHIESGTADLDGAPYSIAARTYSDPMRFEAERKALLKSPLIAGLSVEIPNAGDRLLFDAAGPPIFIIRAGDGSAKAFLNLCPHRGSRLVNDCESASAIKCPFHGWVFDLEGHLRGRPRSDGFDETNGPERSLIPIPVSEWAGLLFVMADPLGGPIDAEAFLGDLAPIIQAMELESAVLVKTERMDVIETNWKLALDTFCEGYHVPVVHSNSLGDQVVPFITIQDIMGIHGRYVGPGRHLESLVGKPEAQWPDSNYSAVHYIFPNTTFTYTDSIDGETPFLTLFRLFPGDSVGKAECLFSSFKPSASAQLSDAEFLKLHDALHALVKNEDFVTASNTWRSLQHAPDWSTLVFGRHEVILREYHRELAQRAGMPLDEADSPSTPKLTER